MKNKYFTILLLCGLLMAFTSVALAQKTKRQRSKQVPQTMIVSNDFDKKVVTTNKNKRAQKAKRWRKRCRWVAVRRMGRIVRVRRCRMVRY